MTHSDAYRKIFAVLLGFIMILSGIGSGAVESAFAASKKPAKVKISSLKASGLKMTLKWKKAKNAKKYQVYVKTGAAKWVLKKTLKKTVFSMNGAEGTEYSFKVRGVNGKKKGRFSAVKKVTIPKKTPVKPADPEEPPEDDESIVVYLSISDDSEFIQGRDKDHTVLARIPLRISYFDLKKYGLEKFYRYEAAPFDEGGEYINKVIVEQPTLLMAYIRAHEKWYFGHEMTDEDEGFGIGGVATSTLLAPFFGHDMNLMYFVNHAYPLMRSGWGSTSDYILLEDGDEIDVGMFTDWNFHSHGAFINFDIGNPQLNVGEQCTIQMRASGTKAAEDGQSVDPGAFPNEFIRISADRGKTWKEKVYKTNYNGEFTVKFDEPGVYIISAGPRFEKQGDNLPCMVPPVSVAEVAPAEICEYSVRAASSTSVKYSWEEIEGATSYQVAYQKSGDTKWTTFMTDDTEAEITKLDPGSTYCFKVQACCESDYVPDEDPYRILKGNYSATGRITL